MIGSFPTGTEMPVALAIGVDGRAYALSYYSDLYSIDLGTGTVDDLGNLGHAEELDAFAVDPTSGRFYAISSAGEAFEVDVTHAETTSSARFGRAPTATPTSRPCRSTATGGGGSTRAPTARTPASRTSTAPHCRRVTRCRSSRVSSTASDGAAYMASQTLLLKFTPRVSSPQGPANIVPADGDRFYTVSCGAVIHGRVAAALPSSTRARASPRLVGASDTGLVQDCPTGAAYDPSSGFAYYFSEFRPTATRPRHEAGARRPRYRALNRRGHRGSRHLSVPRALDRPEGCGLCDHRRRRAVLDRSEHRRPAFHRAAGDRRDRVRVLGGPVDRAVLRRDALRP